MLPAPLTQFAPTYMARSICGENGVARILPGGFVSLQMVGHVGNTRALCGTGRPYVVSAYGASKAGVSAPDRRSTILVED